MVCQSWANDRSKGPNIHSRCDEGSGRMGICRGLFYRYITAIQIPERRQPYSRNLILNRQIANQLGIVPIRMLHSCHLTGAGRLRQLRILSTRWRDRAEFSFNVSGSFSIVPIASAPIFSSSCIICFFRHYPSKYSRLQLALAGMKIESED